MPIAEAVALAGFKWVASPVVKNLVNKSISYLGSDIAEELEDLGTTLLPQFQLTIQAAQQSPADHIDRLAGWLARLKNAYIDAEAILHDLEYERLKREAKGEDEKLLERLSYKPIIKPFVEKASLLSPQKRELLKRLKKLKKVAVEAKTFHDLLSIQNTEIKDGLIAGNNPYVTPLLLTHKVFGRDGDRDQIINFLLDKQEDDAGLDSIFEILCQNFTLLTNKVFGRDRDYEGDCYSVIAVTGMLGAGKTTLAQYVCDDERVKKQFPVIMWLCLSRNLNIIEHTKEMIECASGNECPNLCNLSVLQNKLIETLPQSDNILIVLDDVWYDNGDRQANQWENFLKPFTFRGGICKILVTSRSTSFPIALQPGKHIKLSDLEPDDFTSLLRYHAIDGLQINNPQFKNDLSHIVNQIAKKMSKSPLEAKVVGDQLRERPDIMFWRTTLENVLCLKDTMEILLWSFYRFDVQLQRCFLFCSVFPKGTRFNRATLVSYWVALDFIHPSNHIRSDEDIGLEYFEKMVANSIFHQVDKKYIMQDVFHDLAERLSTEDCFRVTNAERKIPSTVQHVYLQVNNENLKENLSSICNLSNLRTLILENPFINDISEIIPKIAKEKFRNLRVLDIWSRGYKTVPRVVRYFRNLRLLNFGMSSIEKLPNSVLQLYHLQFLRLPSSVKILPTELCNLIKLRRIEMFNRDGAQVNTLPPIPYLGKLTALQGLDEFHVRKEEGYELKQLGQLKGIGGSLRIVNLENVIDKNEAVVAKLIDKTKLKRLELMWDELARTNGLETEVIEALQPPPNLEFLIVDGFRGSTCPTWLHKGSFIEYIKDVRFDNCNALTNLPPNFDQFFHCSKLVLQNLGTLRELSTFPENLASLSIIKCPSLIFESENVLQENEIQSISQELLRRGIGLRLKQTGYELLRRGIGVRLKQTVYVKSCSKYLKIIKSIVYAQAKSVGRGKSVVRDNARKPSVYGSANKNIKTNKLKLPSMLRILDLGDCGVSDGALLDCLRGITTLEELYLSDISTITTLPPAEVFESFQSLQVVEIKNCRDLRSLGGLHALPHLKCFMVQGILYLEMHSTCTSRRLPPTLQSFTIKSCGDPQTFLNDHLPCLQNVEINNCIVPSSRSLSFGQLTNLKSLVLVNGLGLSVIYLPSSFLNTLQLLHLPNLVVESVLGSWHCRELCISSSVMLNKLLSSQDFIPPQILDITYCQEEVISFEKPDHLQSIKKLVFNNCKTKQLPKTLSDFSTLEFIDFIDCPQLLGLPQLPNSVQRITIRGCPVLWERCQPNKGLDWHKIQHIQDKWIE